MIVSHFLSCSLLAFVDQEYDEIDEIKARQVSHDTTRNLQPIHRRNNGLTDKQNDGK